jgi:hypothetical protein
VTIKPEPQEYKKGIFITAILGMFYRKDMDVM